MFEINEELLAKYGFSYAPEGYITNSNGDYVQSVELDGTTMESMIDMDSYKEVKKSNEILQDSEFSYDESMYESEARQKEKVLADYYAKNMHENYATTVVPESVKNGEYYKESMANYVEEKVENEEPVYLTEAELFEGEEMDTALEVFNFTPEERDEYVAATVERKEILESDASYAYLYEKKIEGYQEELDENSWYNPENILLKGGQLVSNLTSGIVTSDYNPFDDEDNGEYTGMYDKDKIKRLKEIDKKIEDLESPFVTEKIRTIDATLERLDKLRTDSEGPQEDLRYAQAIDILEKERKNLDDYLNESSGMYFNSNIFSFGNLVDFGTRGLYGLIADTPAEVMLKYDLNVGNELSPAQTALGEAFATKHEISQARLKQTNWHELWEGIDNSLKYVGFGKIGRKISMKIADKVLVSLTKKSATKGTEILAKTTAIATDVFVSAVLHPNAYSASASEYSGDIYFTDDGVTTDRHTFDTLTKEFDLLLGVANDQLALSQNESEKEEARALIEEVELIQENIASTEPADAMQALGYGIWSTGVENFSEKYFGKAMSKIGGKVKKTGFGRFLKKADNTAFGRATKGSNKLKESLGGPGRAGGRLIGGNIEEWGEEVFVQLVPNVGTSWEEYQEQVGQLLTSDFHTKVLSQTVVMNAGFRGAGHISALHDRNKYRSRLTGGTLRERVLGRTAARERKALLGTLKELGVANQSMDDFNVNMMATGEGQFSMKDYHNKINELNRDGEHVKAAKYQADMIYKQAVHAVNSGLSKNFLNAMHTAKSNNNLDSATKNTVSSLIKEVTEMQSDSNNYINSKKVTELKSKRRFAKQSVKDITMAQEGLEADMTEINKALSEEGLTIEDFYNEHVENFDTKIEKVMKGLSVESENYLRLEGLKSQTETDIKDFNSLVKDATSSTTQAYLREQQAYIRKVDMINARVFKGKMTSKDFTNTVIPKLSSSEKLFGKERLNNINGKINSILVEKQTLERIETLQTPKVAEEVATNVVPSEETSMGKVTKSVKQTVSERMEKIAQDIEDNKIDGTSNKTHDVVEDDPLDFDFLPMDTPDQETMDSLKEWAAEFEKDFERKPTYRDMWSTFVSEEGGDKRVFDKESLEWTANQWEYAGLGNSNWKDIWKEEYTTPTRKKILGRIKSLRSEEEASNSTNDSSSKESVNSVEPEGGTSTNTGDPIPLNDMEVKGEEVVNPEDNTPVDFTNQTPNEGKTAETGNKGNFSAIRSKNSAKQDGNSTTHTKQDKESGVPQLNTESHLNLEELLHPNNNNPGDVLDVRISTAEDWDNDKIKVAVYNENGTVKKYVTFSQWIKENQGNRTIEDFEESDEYIATVPIFYGSKETGNDLMHVPMVEWYNPLSVKDTDKEVTTVNIDNPSHNLKATIKEGQETAMALRRQIMSEDVTEVKITSKGGSPLIKFMNDENGNLIPAKDLTKVANDNSIVLYDGITFIGLDGQEVQHTRKDIVILNANVVEREYKKGGFTTSHNYYLSPVRKEKNSDGEVITYYTAISTLRKNEDNEEGANKEDIETAKNILIANAILHSKKGREGMTFAQAQSIRDDIRKEFKIDIRNQGDALAIVGGLISLTNGNDEIFDAKRTDIPLTLVKDGKTVTEPKYFIDALLWGQGEYFPLQNTSTNPKKAIGVSVKKNGNNFTTTRLAENYEGFLRQRLQTNVMGYDMGGGVYTSSVQPTILVKPIIREKGETTQEKENTTQKVQPLKETSDKNEKTEQEEKDIEAIDAAKKFLQSINAVENTTESEDLMPPDLDDVSMIEEALKTIGGLNSRDQADVIRMLSSILTTQSDPSITSKEAYNKITSEKFIKMFSEMQEELKRIEESMVDVVERHPNDEGMEILLSTVRAQIANTEILLENYPLFFEKAFEEAVKNNFVKEKGKKHEEIKDKVESEDKDHSEEEMVVKDIYKSANETIHKDKIGTRLKRIFANVHMGQTGFMGIKIAEDYDMIYNAVATYLSSPLPTEPGFDAMIKSLERAEKAYPWVGSLIEQLKAAPTDVQNGFVSNMYKYSANARFVMFSKNKANGIQSSLWFSNANNIKQKIRVVWKENFKRTDIVNGDEINKAELKRLQEEYESWGNNKHEQSDEVLRGWLESFGIVLTDGTWEAMKKAKLVRKIKGVEREITFERMFVSKSRGRGSELFDNLYKYAKQNANKKGKLDFTMDDKLSPFRGMSNIMHGLVDLESKHNTSVKTITRRDGGKTVGEIVYPNFFLDTMKKLMKSAEGDKKEINELLEIPFSSSSMLLQMLRDEPELASVFSFGEIGLMSLKEMYSDNPLFSKIDEISPMDYTFLQRTMFQDMTLEKPDLQKDGFKMRIANMSTPTNSDKGRMMVMKTSVYDLFGTDLAFNDDFTFKEELKDMLFERLVMPELSRILSKHESDIKNYKDGEGRFNLMPAFNNLVGSKGQTALDYLASADASLEGFKEQFFDKFTEHMQDSMLREVDSELEEADNFAKDNGYTGSVDMLNNKDYLKKGEKEDAVLRKKRAALDYIINSNIHNMNVMQTIAGDPAIYFKSKLDGKSSSNDVQKQVSRELGVNLGKRLALMIAPGVTLANAHELSSSYIQLFLKDNKVVAPNIEMIIEGHYGKGILSEKYDGITYQEIINKLRKKEYANDKDPQLEHLRLKFEKAAGFLKIENTDAQEYTTLREHLSVMEGLGRITTVRSKEILEKDKLSREDLNMIFQPMKPVYTGEKIEYDKNGKPVQRRIIYIKSSSFPLIPELVKGTPLEPLMNKMNDLEKKHKTTVRASYGSANKVGATNSEIDPLNENELNSLDSQMTLNDNSLVLDRMNFRIQQDVPDKSSKQGDDKVSMGTQIFKLLFGDGLSSLKEGDFDGPQLAKDFHEAFASMVNINKDLLLDELGLDENYSPVDKQLYINKVQELLLKEAKERNFSENDIKSFGISEDRNGNFNFKQPLWLTGNSDKIEAMFNAIINNKIFKQKLPGNAFVVGSNNGITLQTQEEYFSKEPVIVSEAKVGDELVFDSGENAVITEITETDIYFETKEGEGDHFQKSFWESAEGKKIVSKKVKGNASPTNKSQVVYLGDYKGGELQGTEVLAPSRVKVNGQLIDLFERGEDNEYIYIKEGEDGGFVINEDAIDPELFENFVFRTPTSSHGSGSNIKIVGFIPSVMGDLMITPSNFVAQMGQDFDVDKLTAYQYHHIKNYKTGKIERFNESHIEGKIEAATRKVEKLRALAKDAASISDFDKMLLELFPNEFDEIAGEELLSIKEKLEKAENYLRRLPSELNLKVAQNKFIEVHNTIYTSKVAKVQNKINKVLSMDVAETQAEGIDEVVTATSDFNILSPIYQKNKLISGSTGSSAIAIYAKGVTFNSLAQQMKEGSELTLMEEVDREFVPKSITIGRVKSDGKFGRQKTLSVQGANQLELYLARSTAESLDERVNTGTDNEKAQVLGRVGITHIKNVAIDNLMAQLGFDVEIVEIQPEEYDPLNKFHKTVLMPGEKTPKFYTAHSLPYLLHSQPIVKEFFKRLKDGRAITGEISKDLEEKIFNDLVGKYEKQDNFNEKFTGKELVQELSSEINSDFQKEVLSLYIGLMKDAESLKELQQSVDLSNLGKSMWETKDKIEKFKALRTNKNFKNIDGLVGNINTDGIGLPLGGGVFIDPKTNQGVMVGTALSLSRHLFMGGDTAFYPYYDANIEGEMLDIIAISGKKDTPELRQTIFQGMKQYIVSGKENGISTENASLVRRDLMTERDGPSLSTYIDDVSKMKSEEHSEGIKMINNNILLSTMTYEKGVNGKPSLIKFDNTATGNLSEENFHIAMKELIVSNESLPTRNGQPYTTRMLAQDLISYSFVSGGIVSKAIEFHKFIPIEYFEQLKTKIKNKKGELVKTSVIKIFQAYNPSVINWGDSERLKYFQTQFIQNNPKLAKVYRHNDKDIKYSDNATFVLNSTRMEDTLPDYISMKNPSPGSTKQQQWRLYRNTYGNTYERIDVLGSFGMTEYDSSTGVVNTNVGEVITKDSKVSPTGLTLKPAKPVAFKIEKEDTVKSLLEKVRNSNTAYNSSLTKVSETLLELFGDKALEMKVVLDPTINAKGMFDPDTNVITLNPNSSDLDVVFVHEFVHSVTSKYLDQYIDRKTGKILADAPKEVQELNDLFIETSKAIQDKFSDEYKKFKEKYDSFINRTAKGVFFTEREKSLFYPTVNIREYMAVSLTNNNEFIEETSKMTYGDTTMKIPAKFKKVIQRIFNAIAGVENNLGEEIVSMNLSFLESRAKELAPLSQEVSNQQIIAFNKRLNAGDAFRKMPPGTDKSLPSQEISDEQIDENIMPNNFKSCK